MASNQGQYMAALYGSQLAEQNKAATQGQLQGFGNQALGALGQGYGQARTDVTGQIQPSLDALGQGFGQARTDLTGQYGQAAGNVQTGINEYSPWVGSGTAANTMVGNALGLNGAAGNTAAQGAFQASPGYQYQVDQGTDAAARKAASLGVAGSGNTLSAITTLGSNLANQEYGNWLNNLKGVSSQGLTAASGAAQGNYNLGNLNTQLGNNLGNADTALGTAQAGLHTGYGNALASQDTGLGTGQANIYTGLGNSFANVNQNATNSEMKLLSDAGQSQDAANNANSQAPYKWASLGVQGLASGARLFGGGGFGGGGQGFNNTAYGG